MPGVGRIAVWLVCLCCGLAQTGCNMIPRSQLQSAQRANQGLAVTNRDLAKQIQMERDLNAKLTTENQRLKQDNQSLAGTADTLQKRVDNLLGERSQWQSKLASMRSGPSPLSESTRGQFEDLARRYPGFEFDPNTGVSKLNSDVWFQSGSADLTPKAKEGLLEFARILNSGDAKQLNVLVVGHTDDRRVVKPETRAKHPDNWHLSAHRAIAVVNFLSQQGKIKESRMGAAGYGPHQPQVANTTEEARKKNRRVEIFVLAPNATMAGWDPGTSRQ